MRVSMFVLLILMCGAAYAEEVAEPPVEPSIEFAKPYVIAKVVSGTPSWLGQMIQVEVTLFRDNRRENRAPFFEETHVQGGMVQLSKWSPTPEVASTDGVEYLVQHRIYQIFPQYGESIEFPPINVSWFEGEDSYSVVSQAIEIPLKNQATIPKSAWLASPRVTVNQVVAADLDNFRVGDAITRTITIEATDTDAVLIPPMQFEAIDGLRSYISEPELASHTSRGEFTAKRVDKVTYVANRWGFYELPALRIAWFDTASGSWAEAVAEPVNFRARVNPALGSSCVGTREDAPFVTFFILLALLAGSFGWRVIKRFGKSNPREKSEARERYKALVAAIRSGQAVSTLNALYGWFGTLNPKPVTTSAFEPDDELLQAQFENLNRIVAGRGDVWASEGLEKKLHEANRPSSDSRRELHSLNPMINQV